MKEKEEDDNGEIGLMEKGKIEREEGNVKRKEKGENQRGLATAVII